MKKYLCEIYDYITTEHIHWVEVFAHNLVDAEGEGRKEFNRLLRHTKKFSGVCKNNWRARAIEI